MRSAVFLAACLILAVESGRLVRQVKEHVASQVWFVIKCGKSGMVCDQLRNLGGPKRFSWSPNPTDFYF